jgi:glycosyltransferase involved in cell wall biosynthesis
MDTSKYSSSDLALVVPSKNRPIQVGKLLRSILGQSMMPGLIVLVDFGGASKKVCKSFLGQLKIIYINSPVPGQIYQRNLGLQFLNDSFKLIGFIDDDLVFEPKAIAEMINFWNNAPKTTGGVGFNVINSPPFKFSPLLYFFGMSSRFPGKVLKTGYNVSIQNISDNIQSEWLGGGFTVWSIQILKHYKQDSIKTRWAIGEDVRFSYQIGKRFPLFICSLAKVRHEHVNDQYARNMVHFYRGRQGIIAHRYFIEQHPQDFLVLFFFWMVWGKFILRIIKSLLNLSWPDLMRGVGEMTGLILCFISLIRGKSIRNWLED